MKTPPKKLIVLTLAALIFLIGSLVTTFVDSKAGEEPVANCGGIFYDEDFTYERVYEYGKWWIYVYDEDRHIIAIYEEE